MSTILQALRRAESERQRGQVPSIHSPEPGMPPLATPAPEAPRQVPRWTARWVFLAGLVVLACIATWQGRKPEVAPEPPASETHHRATPAVPPRVEAIQPPAQVTQAESAPAPATLLSSTPHAAPPTLPGSASRPLGAPMTPPVFARPKLDKEPGRTPRAGPPPKSSSDPAQGPPPSPEPAQPGSPEAEARVLDPAPPAVRAEAPRALAQLPAGLQQALAGLRLGGSVHAAEPSARLLLVNGQVLREGAELAPGVLLLEIGLDWVRLGWEGGQHRLRL